jgi:hypothetical protein
MRVFAAWPGDLGYNLKLQLKTTFNSERAALEDCKIFDCS